jgi:hypothetical protein
MGSEIIFDVATKPFTFGPLWAAIGALVFGCVLILLGKLKRRQSSRIMGYFMALFAVLYAGDSSARWYSSRRDQMKNLAVGRYGIVQGTVENFHPVTQDGRSDEWFTISGHKFSYSDHHDLETTPCFNQTRLRRGPIHDGMFIRMKFVDQCILQIEVLSQNLPARPG